MTTASPTQHDVVDLLERVNTSELANNTSNVAERVALLLLDTAANREHDITMSVLARRLGMSRAAVTSMADRLDAGGYVERVLHPADRRCTLLRITPAGRKLVATATKAVA